MQQRTSRLAPVPSHLLPPAHSFSRHYTPPLTTLSFLFFFLLPFSSWSERIGWATGFSLPNRWALLVLAEAQAMVGERTRRGRETESKKQKGKERELERKGEKRSSTRLCQRSYALVQHWFGSFFFLPILCSALPGTPICVCVCVRLEPGPGIRTDTTNYTCQGFFKNFFKGIDPFFLFIIFKHFLNFTSFFQNLLCFFLTAILSAVNS